MFTVFIGAILTTLFWIASLFGASDAGATGNFILAVAIWLWLTVLFSNFAEAVAEGRGKAQAAELRKTRSEVKAVKLAAAQWDAKKRNRRFGSPSFGRHCPG